MTKIKEVMEDSSLANAMRYMFPGVVTYSYLYVSDSSVIKGLNDSFGTFETTISLVVLGSIIYLIYRPLFYDGIIVRLQDKFRLNSDNYRTFLKKRYNLNTYMAKRFFIKIRDKYLKDHYSEDMKILASGIHFIYIAGIVAMPFAIWRGMAYDYNLAVIFFLFALLFMLSGFLLDRYYEDRELDLLLDLGNAKLDSEFSSNNPAPE